MASGRARRNFIAVFALAPIIALTPPISAQSTESGQPPVPATLGNELVTTGRIQWQTGDTKAALQTLNRALVISVQTHNKALEAGVRLNRGQLYAITGNTDTALADLKSALHLREQLDDSSGEAEALSCIAHAYIVAGQYTQALTYLNRAHQLWERVSAPLVKAQMLNDFGDYLNWSGDRDQALEMLTEALGLARAASDSRVEATILNNTGEVWWALAKPDKALELYKQALSMREDIHDKDGVAVSLVDIAEYDANAGATDDALRYDERALNLFSEVGDRTNSSAALNNIGAMYESLGHPEMAITKYQKALAIEREVHNTDFESITIHAIGALYQNTAEPQRALSYYRQALNLERQSGHKSAEAGTLSNIAGAEEELQRPLTALVLYRKADQIQAALKDYQSEAITLNDIGTTYLDLKKTSEAITNYQHALSLEESGHYQATEAFTLWHLAHLTADRDLFTYFAALSIAQQSRSPLITAQIESSLMDEFRGRKNPKLAIYFGEKAVNTYQQVADNLNTFDQTARTSFLRSKSSTYRTLAEILAVQGRLLEAENVLDLLKIVELHETVRGATENSDSAHELLPTSSVAEIDSKLTSVSAAALSVIQATAERQRLASLVRTKTITKAETSKLDALDDELRAANAQVDEFIDAAFRAESTRPGDATARINEVKAATSSLVKALATLGPGSIALYTIFGSQHCYIIAVSGASNPVDPEDVTGLRRLYELPVSPAALTTLILHFHSVADSGSGDLTPYLAQLDEVILAPIANELSAASSLAKDKIPTILWSLDGLLAYVPMAALYDGSQPPQQRYFVARARNVYITPESLAYLTDSAASTPLSGVALGISKSMNGLNPLPKVLDELDAVVHDRNVPESVHGAINGVIYHDEEFTFTRLKGLLAVPPHPPVIHIASHFVFQCSPDSTGKCTRESYLLVSDATGNGYPLTLTEMGKLSFSGTRLVTLAACGTGEADKDLDSRPIASLGMVVQRRFAPAVLATLWNVVDGDGTTKFMADFYRRWVAANGIAKGEVLRQAQLDMIRGVSGAPTAFRDPHYWAPFVLYGNMR